LGSRARSRLTATWGGWGAVPAGARGLRDGGGVETAGARLGAGPPQASQAWQRPTRDAGPQDHLRRGRGPQAGTAPKRP
jgi:hypothetical protein